jgi:hypothetical protein
MKEPMVITHARALVAKALRLGFYWLSALHDAKKIIKQCDTCQHFATGHTRPHQN